ncbi:ATP-binding protein [Sphingomonas sp. RS6]
MKRSLILMGLTGILPIVVLGAAYGYVSLQEQRAALDRQALIASRASARLIGRELSANIDAVAMLAQSPSFDGTLDRDRFNVLAKRLIDVRPTWRRLGVSDRAGNRLLVVPPVDAVLAGKVIDRQSLIAAFETGKPQVGHVVRGPLDEYVFAIRAPAMRDGTARYVVSAVLPARGMAQLLLAEAIPGASRVRLFDDRGALVAAVGSGGPGPLRSATSVVPGTAWRVEFAVPGGAFAALTRQARMVLILGALIALLLFVALVLLLRRELGRYRDRQAATVQAQRLEALGRLTGGVAHDLNNLLTPILGGLDLLRKRCPDDTKALRYIDNAVVSAERARSLVARLLAYSRRQTLAPEAIDPAIMFDDLRDLLERSAGAAIPCIVTLNPAPPILADRNQLELAILNLVINARDAISANENGDGRIAIEVRPAREEELRGLSTTPCVAISVHDDGCGMDALTLRRAVEPFFTTKAGDRGTGLGLSMVHGFAEQSSGRFLLQSAPGEGTSATLVLPCAAAPAAQPAAAPAALPSRTADILLVDDDAPVREAAAEVLRAHGHSVREAASLNDGMAQLAAQPSPDLIITDYMMPGGTGGEFITRARAESESLRFLLLTGYVDSADDLPADVPQLRKPFRDRELLVAVDALLD